MADGQQASGDVEAEVGPIEPAAHARNELQLRVSTLG